MDSFHESIWAFVVLAFAFGGVFAAERAEIEVKFKDGSSAKSERFLDFKEGKAVLKIPASEIDPRTESISIPPISRAQRPATRDIS